MALEVEADRRVTGWLYVRCPSAWRCDSPDRDLRSRAAKRATMLFPGRNRDTLRDCEESENCRGSLFGRRASLLTASASAASPSGGHGDGLPALSSHLSQGDRPGCCHPTSRNPGWSTSWRKRRARGMPRDCLGGVVRGWRVGAELSLFLPGVSRMPHACGIGASRGPQTRRARQGTAGHEASGRLFAVRSLRQDRLPAVLAAEPI